MDRERVKNLYFRQNAFGVSAVEFFWGLGIPIVLESTFLQLFLKNLGASSFAIGLVPALFMVGISCFPLFSSYYTRNLRYKRREVIILHLVSGAAILFFGLTLRFTQQAENVLPLFFACYAVFSACLGLTIPLWLNYLVRIFSDARAVPGLGYMMLFQNIGKMISSLFILKIVERYSFSVESSAWVFIGTGLLFSLGSFWFLVTNEVAEKERAERDNRSFPEHTRKTFMEITGNRNFLIFLAAADMEFVVIITTISFYANYATQYYAVPAAIAAGLFVASIYAGSITVNILLGTMNLLGLKQKFVLSKCLTFVALLLLAFFPHYLVFFLVSFMLGFVRAVRNMVYAPSIKKFSGRPDATSYFAFAPVLTLPLSVGYPLFFGKTLDLLAAFNQYAYQFLFLLSALVALFSLFCAIKTDYSKAPVLANGVATRAGFGRRESERSGTV